MLSNHDRILRLNLATAEMEALTAWSRSGSEGTPPSTPNLDALREQYGRRLMRAERKAQRTEALVQTHRAKKVRA